MGNLYDTLTACLTDQLIQAVLSAARKKDGPSRVKIRPVLPIKEASFFRPLLRWESSSFMKIWKKRRLFRRSRNGS